MNTYDDPTDRLTDWAAANFHRNMWPLHTNLRALRRIDLRLLAPRMDGLSRQDKTVVSGAMVLLRYSAAPWLVGSCFWLAAALVPAAQRAPFVSCGSTLANIGLTIAALAVTAVLAVRVRRAFRGG